MTIDIQKSELLGNTFSTKQLEIIPAKLAV